MKCRLTLLCLAVTTLSACGGDSNDDASPVALTQASCAAAATSRGIAQTAITRSTLVAATATVPEYCRVEGTIKPEDASNIRFAVNLPTTNWNRRFMMIGNGGYAGGALPAGGQGLADGYATAVTDTGHASTAGTAFYNNRVVEVDYGYRAVHLTAGSAKQVIEQMFKVPARTSYFNGCSTGGRQALMEAQRYPADFNGIVGGSPAADLTGLAIEQNWSLRQFHDNAFAGNIFGKLPLIVNAMKAQCADAEGLVTAPASCRFDVGTLACAVGQDASTCLTPAQVTAVKRVYAGPSSSTGTSWYAGKPFGSEVSWGTWLVADSTDPSRWSPAQGGFGFSFVNNLFFETDPPTTYQWTDFNFDTDPPLQAFMAGILNATNPDISAFQQAGGKLMLYHGLADGLITWQRTVKYYDDVQTTLGAATGKASTRLFLVPGMDHCDGFDRGGLSVADWMGPLVNWVENGVAPDSVPATTRATNPVKFARPVCAYPATATYTGTGARADAANWRCVAPG
jgi:feruloyl esterase